MFIDFLGDKGGARFTYWDKFEFFDGQTLETITPEYDIPDMRWAEDKAFLEVVENGGVNRNNIDDVLETMKLLDALYASADNKKEISF